MVLNSYYSHNLVSQEIFLDHRSRCKAQCLPFALVSGDIWYLNETLDRTSGSKPYPFKKTFEISGFVTSNANFNGSFHGKLYVTP